MFIIPAILENLTSRKDGTWKLTFGSNELSPEQIQELAAALNKFTFLAIKVDQFHSEEREILESTETGLEETGKTQSQRIRGVLFILWKQNPEGFTDFENYYRNKTEKFIDHLKTKIDN